MSRLPINKKQGFTLIETFVAVLILVFAVIGPLGLMARAISDSNFTKNQVTAYFLAQEALELVVNQRDSNSEGEDALAANWLDGLDCLDGCSIDIDQNGSLVVDDSCGAIEDAECTLYIRDDDGLRRYTHDDNDAESSLFSRLVTIEVLEDGKRARVTALVRWLDKTRPVDFSLSTVLLNQLDISSGDDDDDDPIIILE